jgi:hypothetical protein
MFLFLIHSHLWIDYCKIAGQGGSGEEFYYLASLPIGKHFPQLQEDVVVPEHPRDQVITSINTAATVIMTTTVAMNYSLFVMVGCYVSFTVNASQSIPKAVYK